MRPSDVPDLRRARRGRPRHHRQGRAAGAVASATSTSCSTSATAAAGWSSPRARATTRSASRCAGSARVRIATKYPRIAARHFAEHRPPGGGRRGQGLGRAGAADRASPTGSSTSPPPAARCAENDLECCEEIARLHRAPDRQPGRAQAEGRRDRRARGADAGRDEDCARAATSAGDVARCRPPRGVEAEVREILDDVRARGDDAVLELDRALRPRRARPEQLRVDRRELEAALGVARPRACCAGLRTAIANVRPWWPRRSCASPSRSELAAGPAGRARRAARPARRRLRARRAGRPIRRPW